jgi:hypothetical protein
MPRKRPTAVLVMAILNIVFGSLGLACYLCAGVGILFIVMALNQPGAAKAPEMRQVQEIFQSMAERIPGFLPVMIGNLIFSFVMAIWLLVCGIGLLKMMNWARIGSIIFAILTILEQLGSLIYRFTVLNPGMEAWQRDFLARHPGAQIQGNAFGGASPALNSAMEILGVAISLGYAIVLLVFMLLPGVVAAFRAPEMGEEAAGGPEEEEYYDRGERWGE